MHQTQQKILQQSVGAISGANIPMPHLHSPPPHLIPGLVPIPQQGYHNLPPPQIPPPHMHMQFMAQNRQFPQQQQQQQGQQQNSQNIQMHSPQPNMSMLSPSPNLPMNISMIPPMNQSGSSIMPPPPPPMFNPQFMNQFPPLNNQQHVQNLGLHPLPVPGHLHMQPMNQQNQPFGLRAPSNMQSQNGGYLPPMQQPPHPFTDFNFPQQQLMMLPNQIPNIQANHLVFNPSKQQLQQQHEIHLQKFQKDETNRKRTRWGDQVQLITHLTPQQLNQQHFIMPGTTQSGGNQNQKRVVLNSKNPEMLSGSLMAELVKQNNRKITEETGKFQKYQPIKPEEVADYIYIDNRDQNALKSKLNHLLDYADDQREIELKSLEKKKKERERELELKKMEEQGIDTYELRNPDKKSSTRRNIEREVEELYAYPVSSKNEMMNAEMGIRSDGRLAGPQHQGLGGNQDTVFSAFRMARSKNYHATAEERSSFRDKGSDLCFKCSRPGHIARECKYGMS